MSRFDFDLFVSLNCNMEKQLKLFMGYTDLSQSEPTAVNKYILKLYSDTENNVIALNVHSATKLASFHFGLVSLFEISKKNAKC